MEHLSVQQLENKVKELNQRLQQSEKERNKLHQQLEECNGEKEMCLRRLEVVSAAHECRITEMHCVIAELSKKLRAKQESTILEEAEPEPEGSGKFKVFQKQKDLMKTIIRLYFSIEISYQEGSIYNSELNLTNPDAECQTDPLEAADYSTGDDNLFCTDVTEEVKVSNEGFFKGQVEVNIYFFIS